MAAGTAVALTSGVAVACFFIAVAAVRGALFALLVIRTQAGLATGCDVIRVVLVTCALGDITKGSHMPSCCRQAAQAAIVTMLLNTTSSHHHETQQNSKGGSRRYIERTSGSLAQRYASVISRPKALLSTTDIL